MSDVYLTRDQHRYAVISPGAFYESQVQSLVERNIASIFPEYFGKKSEPYLKTAAGDVKPDLVLLKYDLSGWAVVEVEDDTHPFRRHILPQISKMTYVEADEKTVQHVWRTVAPDLSRSLIEQSLSRKPEVFLVVHGSSEAFSKEIKTLNVIAIDIDIHCSLTQPNEYVLVVHDYGTNIADLGCVAVRSSNPLTKHCWTIESQELAKLLGDRNRVEVHLDSTSAFWGISVMQSGAILRQPSDLLHAGTTLSARVLFNTESGAIHLVP